MSSQGDIKKLKSSWTKYDVVQMIEIIGTNTLNFYLSGEKEINVPILKSYLGIENLNDPIPSYWVKIQNFHKQKRLFALIAGIFTHHENITLFADSFSTSNMQGIFNIGDGGKHMTNLRSALVVSGATKNSFRRKSIVPYDLTLLFSEGEVGPFFKELLIERLIKVGYSTDYIDSNFYEVCYELNFHKALSLNKDQFKRWITGKAIYQVKDIQYDLTQLAPAGKIHALKVSQWLNSWDDIDYDAPMRQKPEPQFYIFNMDIRLLKRLSDVHRRKANKKRMDDPSIQRSHDEKRSKEIKKFVEGGFPWSTINDSEKEQSLYKNLKMPGMLPTTIVANILGPNQKRGNSTINNSDLIKIEHINDSFSSLIIPDSVFSSEWDPELKPFEIIDGQHRLMAFDETEQIDGKFEVPIVAYYNLDRTWQAYLFYVINIKPKKINTSLGYDLYPLLRTQEWLENSKDGLSVYRETRAQELVEALWIYEQSPWCNRINMLGTSEGSNLSQASFIRALTSSYLRKSVKNNLSGLFADVLSEKNFEEIKWIRAQQAAFLILLWERIALQASSSKKEWAEALKSEKKQLIYLDSFEGIDSGLSINDAFLSKNSMLSRDQGVGGISLISNDFFFVAANYFDDYDFNAIEWKSDIDERQIEINSIDEAIEQFKNDSIYSLIDAFSEELMNFDWRMTSANFNDPLEKEKQKKYKGSGGYRDIWFEILNILKQSENSIIKKYSFKIEEIYSR